MPQQGVTVAQSQPIYYLRRMMHQSTHKKEYARLFQLAANEEMSADLAAQRGDDTLLIERHRRRAALLHERAISVRCNADVALD